jgi:hypothetical protein
VTENGFHGCGKILTAVPSISSKSFQIQSSAAAPDGRPCHRRSAAFIADLPAIDIDEARAPRMQSVAILIPNPNTYSNHPMQGS